MSNIEDVLLENELLKAQIMTMQESFFWKLTGPCRSFVDFIKETKRKLFSHSLNIKNFSMRYFWTFRHGELLPYQAFGLTHEKWINQKNHQFNKNIHISIVTVLHNTNIKYLHDMALSVLSQTYSNWDFTILDFSTEEHQKRNENCKKLAEKDIRIKYVTFDNQQEISSIVNQYIDMATGEYIFILNQNDILHPSAFFEIISLLQNENADFIYGDECSFYKDNIHSINETYFKPDFAPDYFYSTNYIRHCVALKKTILAEIDSYNVFSDYDLYLKIIEKTEKISHISKCLYFERTLKENDTDDLFFKKADDLQALQMHFKRAGINASVSKGSNKNCHKISYSIEGNPLVSIIIPSKDHWQTLKTCINSIRKSTWKNYEIIIIENNSKEPETFEYYNSLKDEPYIKVLYWEKEFNYSAINNFGFENAKGDHILLLNNDVEVISDNWLEEMLMYSQQTQVGAVGAKLYFPSGKIQHAGAIITNSHIDHSFKFYEGDSTGYNDRLITVQDYTAVTAACIMIPRKVFTDVCGLEEIYKIAYNDMDLCLKIRNAGYRIVWTPYAELYHYESESRGQNDTIIKKIRNRTELSIFKQKWQKMLNQGDSYYNSNLDDFFFFTLNKNAVFSI